MARRDLPGPYSLEALAGLALPELFTRDPDVLVKRYVAWFEAETNRTLYPMQVEMLLIETLAYAMSLLGEEGQATAQEHLVAKASALGLGQLGANRSTPRLEAAQAVTTLRLALTQVRPINVLISEGARVSAGSGGLVFLTQAPAVIVAGSLFADVPAIAAEPGAAANGLLPGQISTMLDPVAGVTASNIVVSEGGADIEDLELWRLRTANAFDRISTGGSHGWYRETAMGVSSSIIDVAVVRPQPCYVDIYPLTRTGAAGEALRAQVKATFDSTEALDIRFGDEVTVKPPAGTAIAPTLNIRLRGATAGANAIAASAANQVLIGWREQLGSAVAPSEIEDKVKAALKADNFVVIDVEVTGMPFAQLGESQFAQPTLIASEAVVVTAVGD